MVKGINRNITLSIESELTFSLIYCMYIIILVVCFSNSNRNVIGRLIL